MLAAYEAFDGQSADPRHASTVVLLRDRDEGMDVYLLRRHGGMAFAGGMYAFPGGGVDPRDSEAAVDDVWAGPPPEVWAERLGTSTDVARALVCAAVRETFEESTVLLAGPDGETLVDDTTGDSWEADRQALLARELALSDLLRRRGLVLRSDLLQVWAHWVTPAFEPRRYDTAFFVARMPAGQRTRDVSGEADRVVWMSPAEAVAGADGGELLMLPPTYVTVAEMAARGGSAQVMADAADRLVPEVHPGVEVREGVPWLTLPEEAWPR